MTTKITSHHQNNQDPQNVNNNNQNNSNKTNNTQHTQQNTNSGQAGTQQNPDGSYTTDMDSPYWGYNSDPFGGGEGYGNQGMGSSGNIGAPPEEQWGGPQDPGAGYGQGGSGGGAFTGGSLRGNMSGGMGGGETRMNFGAPGSGGDYGGADGYGGMSQNQFMWDTLVGGQMRDNIYAQRQQVRQTESQMKVKMNMIMFMIMMGDVVGAVRAMTFESERQNRVFNRLLVTQLDKVRQAKSKVLLAMAQKPPPTAHNNTNNPQGAANDQNAQAKYTQWVSVTTQLMSELQNTERQLMDLMSEARRNIDQSWEAYSGMKEADARTTRTVIQSFRA